ncbi:HAD family hydrolase [Paenibacillus sp. GYB003]|uniref:HAD family hydrolase n=1 Tax=Paenibacillus sp. GYB003 TaxID=2994392 RepID=UPI002F9615B7
MNPTFKIVLFDLDDTLILFEDYWEDSLLETFRQHGCTKELDPALLFEVFWEMNRQFVKLYHSRQISLRDFRNVRLIRALGTYGIEIDEETADDFNALHRSLSKRFMKANPELIELLTQLKQSYSLGIVTNGTCDWQLDKIEALGIRSLFPRETIVTSEEAGCEKPAMDIYLQALARFKAEPEHVLFVGDSWENDVEGPMRAGMQAVWFNRTGDPLPEGGTPYGVIRTLSELRVLLELK